MKIVLPQSDSSLRNRRLTLRLRVALSMTVLAMLLNIAVMLFVLVTIPEATKIMSLGRSLFGMSLMVLITGVSAYWVAGMALRPVREISQAAHSIYADILDTRLYVSGPEVSAYRSWTRRTLSTTIVREAQILSFISCYS